MSKFWVSNPKVGVIGSSTVGKVLANAFVDIGCNTMISSRDPKDPKLAEWQKSKIGSFKEAATFGEVIVMCTPGTAHESVVKACGGPGAFEGKVVIDTTNPLDYSPLKLVGGLGTSAGEILQNLLPKSHVVKCFNTVGNGLFYKPQLEGGIIPTMLICGNSQEAKESVSEMLVHFGWKGVDAGGIDMSHHLESVCAIWVGIAFKTKNFNWTFSMIPGAEKTETKKLKE